MAEIAAQPLATQQQRIFQFPGSQHIGLMLTVATMAAVLIAGYLWSQAPDYRVLYGNLSDRDGGGVVAALQQANVPYKFGDGGALLVPASQVHEMRLKLASQGLPKGGLVGFEVMEGQKFGTSQFAEQVNYQRALEGELARSIQSLASVQHARVHLALTKPSAFMREQPKPSASILLNLYAGRTLDEAQASAIVHLVSSSVPGLQAQSVTLVDQNGNLLSSQNSKSPGGLDASQLKYRQTLELAYNARIEDILTPIVGANNVRAQVAAELDFSESEDAQETYRPNKEPAEAAIRSQQTSESTPKSTTVGGVPGAMTNQPPGPASAPIDATATTAAATTPPVAANATPTNKDATINYEVDKTVRHTRLELGRIKRLAVAVVVNHRKQVDKAGKVSYVPLPAAEIEQITNLVREVVAHNKERGDTVSVVNSPFSIPDKEKIVEEPLWKQPQTINLATTIGKNALIAAVLLFVVMVVLRPILKSYSKPAAPVPVAALPAELTDDASKQQVSGYDQRVDQAKQIARDDPKKVAQVVKEWVSDGK